MQKATYWGLYSVNICECGEDAYITALYILFYSLIICVVICFCCCVFICRCIKPKDDDAKIKPIKPKIVDDGK